MSTVYNGNGSLVTPTTGANTRIAISSSTNASPIVVTTSGNHGYNTGDTIEIEGHAVNTNANGVNQITVQSPTTYALNGTTGNGVGGATGYSIDYELLPAITLPAGGELADPGVMGAVLEGLANPAPFLYRKSGKWRLYNQYLLAAGLPLSLPWISNPWSSQTGLTSGSFTAFNSGQFTLQSLSDTTGIAPYSGPNEFWILSVSMSMLITPSANNIEASVGAGAQIAAGTGIAMLGMPFSVASMPVNSSIARATVPVTVCGAFESNFNSSNLYLTLTYRVDNLSSGSVSLYLVGQATGYALQYRLN